MTDIELEVDCDSPVFEKSASAPSSPTEGGTSVRRDISTAASHGKSRRVTFPDDDTIVTGYFDAPDPWSDDYKVTMDNIVAAYRAACWKQGVKPLQRVLQQLQTAQASESFEIELNLKGENLDYHHCEALEEVFKRLRFKILQLEATHLDDEGAAAIFDMIEYYDSTTHLNISFNKTIGNQGWQACSKMLKKTPCLQYLDARNTAQNEQSLLILGRAFRTGSNLVILHLESCGLFGRPLVILVAALKLNTTLQELYLGENKISPADGLQLGNLLRSNSVLELLDLRSNNLQDLGVCHLVDGLCQQTASFGDGLKTLVLRDNHLTHNAMAHINRSLLVCYSFMVLDIGHNNICNEGIHQLKQGLLSNQSLRHLGLQDTKMTCEGAVALAEYIADNQYITHLDLEENDIKVAGLMALALSMKHNHSITDLNLDQAIKKDNDAPDGIQNHRKLLQEIQEYCHRNKLENSEDDENFNASVQSFTPVVFHQEAELSSVYREKHNQGRIQTVGITHPSAAGMVVSASFPSGSKSAALSSSLPRNRFQVCRVFLDGDKKNNLSNKDNSKEAVIPCDSNFDANDERVKDFYDAEDAVFYQSEGSSEESRSNSQILSVCQNNNTIDTSAQDDVKRDAFEEPKAGSMSPVETLDRGKGILCDHKASGTVDLRDSAGSVDDDASHNEALKSQLSSRRPSGNKANKRITFLLPENEETRSHEMRKDRRMSTPTLTSSRLVTHQHKALTLKLGRQLESLDLRSSVPLSPTRLREGLVFPEPFVLKLPVVEGTGDQPSST